MGEAFDIERLVALVEEAITESGFHIPDSIGGTTSTPRKHQSATVTRISTVNTEQLRNQRCSRVEDTLQVELHFVVKPGQQRETRRAAYESTRRVRNNITRLAHRQLRESNPTHLSDEDLFLGEYFQITSQYRFRRYEEVGRES